ncbi:hypothetical protein JKL49_06460 [Phenylobacterium sp. 20VBR1]|uniref:Uncharacterized protein n=1 Tax=Phenylobacterium glaciei TaxID=2803784 RepID=A0A941D2E6_9CAUL|nr:hypothetical protein [Phenylobacterium glaciei]MBR7619028.1 hypothetical protein [Phenylobacterium glaciei]QQZ51381.1 hypothetical protein JKL49_10270 [Phenylobacterium glaciei]
MKAIRLSLLLLLAAPAAHAQSEGWALAAPKDGDATLTYGEFFTARCVRGSGQIVVTARTAPTLFQWRPTNNTQPLPVSITVVSGAVSTTLRGEAILHPDGHEAAASTEIATRAPVIDAFRKTGVIQVLAGSQILSNPLPTTPRLARGFLNACR